MKVSILMAAYNSADYIRETLESVLAQTMTDWECIVIDDGSTDETPSIVREYAANDGRIRLLQQRNQGCGMARNTGLKKAKGDYICGLDSDDLIPADYFARACDYLDTHPDCLVWMARKERFGKQTGISSMTWKGYRGQLRENQLYASAIHRRSEALRVGGWKLREGYEDWDFWLRMLDGKGNEAVHTDTEGAPFRYRAREDSLLMQERPRDHRYRRDIRRANKEVYDRLYARNTARGNEDILVVIPYLAEGAQGNELIWATKGWRDHFREDFTLVIVGDEPPIGAEYDYWIACSRIAPVEGQYTPHLDMVHKFRAVRERFRHAKGFIYSCDDIYPVNDFGLEDILMPKINQREMDYDPDSGNAWERDEAKTRDWLKAHGLATRGWICHLPVYMEWDKWEDIVNELGADKESYVIEEVYFNTWYATRPAVLMGWDKDPYRVRIERPDFDVRKLREGMKGKTFVCNSVAGYTEELERIMNEYHGI